MMGSLRPGLKVFAILLLLLGPGCTIRVPFVGIRIMDHQGVSKRGDERIVTTYTHDGKSDRLEVYKGRIKLNGVDYGPIKPGDQVVLTGEGLQVNEENRAPAKPSSDK